MDWTPILAAILPIVITFALGLVLNKPGYKKGKAVLATIQKALADDKIDSTEIEEFMDHFKKPE
jgi:hypothetical protein